MTPAEFEKRILPMVNDSTRARYAGADDATRAKMRRGIILEFSPDSGADILAANGRRHFRRSKDKRLAAIA